MKKLTIITALLVFLSAVVFAQSYNSGSSACMSLDSQKKECANYGGYVIEGTDWSGSCEYIRCRNANYGSGSSSSSTTPTITDSCGNGTCSSPETPQDCPQDCTPKTSCTSVEEQKRYCEQTNGVVGSEIDYDGQGCSYIRCRPKIDTSCTAEYAPVCGTDNRTYGNKCELDRVRVGLAYSGECKNNCRSEAELEKEKTNCENSGGRFNKWEKTSGCYESMCEMTRPSCEWVEREKERCKLSGGNSREEKMDYSSGPNSCPMVVCDYPSSSGYSGREECESATNCFCEYKMCDTIPKGQSYESFCGKNFKPGYYCMTLKKPDGDLECGGSSSSYCPSGYHCEMPQGSDWRAKGKCVKDNYSCPEERSDETERRRVECEKAGGKLVKEKDKWSSSSCEYSVCISQNMKCGNVPSSVGMLRCPEGYYCEQPMNSGYAGPGYTQEEGKCIPLSDRRTEPKREEKKCPAMSEEELARQKNKCTVEHNGVFNVKTDAQGCTYTDCTFTRTEPLECMKDEEVKELFRKCTTSNGLPKVKSEKGCVQEVACLIEERREDKPKRELPPEEAKDQDLGKLFNVAFKLEEVRAQFTGLKTKTLQIAEFYESQGDSKYAEKFRTVSQLFNNAINEVDNIKASLREKIEKDEVNNETFSEIKTALAKVKDSMKDILKELLR